jgi:hypothetical protein
VTEQRVLWRSDGWREHAACAHPDVDPRWFDLPTDCRGDAPDGHAKALTYCNRCPVTAACLEAARVDGDDGVRGGVVLVGGHPQPPAATPRPTPESRSMIMTGQRALVTGGRDYNDAATVNATLSQLAPSWIAQGGAAGADALALAWARRTKTPFSTYPADWATYGKAAGPIRNRYMLDHFRPDVVVAFPGGRGTEHMVAYADFCGVPVIRAVPPVDSGAPF